MWFGVSIFMKGDCATRAESDILWQENIVLVEADSEAEALRKGQHIGKNSEDQYVSATGENIQWRFWQVERAYEIEGRVFETGTELFSRFLRASEATSLLTPFEDPAEGGKD